MDILAVVVLYGKNIDSSNTLQTLNAVINGFEKLDVLIYDNNFNKSKTKSIFENLNIIYYHDQNNHGIATAYNVALKKATELNKKWLMLLDQDTDITSDYWSRVVKLSKDQCLEKGIVALTPFLKKGNVELSPVLNRSEQNVWWFQKPVKEPGCYGDCITAFNSATLLSVDFMNSIGGFSEKYPLDSLDYWYFHQIHKNKKKVYVLDTKLEHDLSVLDYNKNMNLIRYQSILNSELAFAKEVGINSLILYKLRIFFRFFKQLIFIKDKKYAYNTFLQFWK